MISNRIRKKIRQFVDGYSAEGRSGALERQDIGYLVEGLAYALIPLREATDGATRQYNLGPRGAYILRLLANGLRYPGELADALGCGRPIITAELARLTDAGLVIAGPGKKDRRRSELRLTELGEEEAEMLRQEIWRIVTANLAAYTPDEIRKFAVMLNAVRGEPTEST